MVVVEGSGLSDRAKVDVVLQDRLCPEPLGKEARDREPVPSGHDVRSDRDATRAVNPRGDAYHDAAHRPPVPDLLEVPVQSAADRLKDSARSVTDIDPVRRTSSDTLVEFSDGDLHVPGAQVDGEDEPGARRDLQTIRGPTAGAARDCALLLEHRASQEHVDVARHRRPSEPCGVHELRLGGRLLRSDEARDRAEHRLGVGASERCWRNEAQRW